MLLSFLQQCPATISLLVLEIKLHNVGTEKMLEDERTASSICSHTVERDQRAKRYGLNHRMAFFFFFPLINYSYVPKGGVGNLLSGFRTENVASNSGKDGLKIHLYKHSLLFSTKPFVINQIQSFDIPSQSVVCSKSYVVENREGDI